MDAGAEDEVSSAAVRDARMEPALGQPHDVGVDGSAQDRVVELGQPSVVPPGVPLVIPPVIPRVPPSVVPVPAMDTTLVLQQLLVMQSQTVRLLGIMQQITGMRRDRDDTDGGDRRQAQFQRRDDHGRADDRDRPPAADGARVDGRGRDRSHRLRCWMCGVRGHVRAHCPRAEARPGVPRDDGRRGDRTPRGRAGRLHVVQRADAERREDVLAG